MKIRSTNHIVVIQPIKEMHRFYQAASWQRHRVQASCHLRTEDRECELAITISRDVRRNRAILLYSVSLRRTFDTASNGPCLAERPMLRWYAVPRSSMSARRESSMVGEFSFQVAGLAQISPCSISSEMILR